MKLINLEYEINQLERQIISYHSAFNKQAVWLLLASMSCASLKGQTPLQISAYICVGFFYVGLSLEAFRSANKSRKMQFDAWDISIVQAVKILQREIEQKTEGVERSVLLKKLDEQCKHKIRFREMWRYKYLWIAFIFFWCCAFYSAFSHNI